VLSQCLIPRTSGSHATSPPIMTDKLTDTEIVEELKKRPLLIKKINSLRAKENNANTPKKTTNSRPKQNLEFSSEDESEEESRKTPTTNRPTNRLFGRKSVRPTSSPYYSNTDTIEISPNDRKTNLRSRKNMKDQSTPSSSTSPKLYPDLTGLKAAAAKTDGWKFQRGAKKNSEISYEYPGEFTDSDPDESTYEVENKSVNTTFTLGPDLDDDDEENDGADYSTYVSRVSPGSKSRDVVKRESFTSTSTKRISSNHVPVNSFTEEEIRQQSFQTYEDSRKFKPPVASYVSTGHGSLICVAVFFLSLAMTWVYMRRDFLYSMILYVNSLSGDSRGIKYIKT